MLKKRMTFFGIDANGVLFSLPTPMEKLRECIYLYR